MIYILRSRKLEPSITKIVRAKDQHEARMIANRKTGSEGRIWMESSLVTCRFIAEDSKPIELCVSGK